MTRASGYFPESEYGRPRWLPAPGNALDACRCIGQLRSRGGDRSGACLRVGRAWILTAHHLIDVPTLADRFEVTFGNVAPGAPTYTYRLDAAGAGFLSSADGIQGKTGYLFDLDYAFLRLAQPDSAGDPSVNPRYVVNAQAPARGSRAYIPRCLQGAPLQVESPDPNHPSAGSFTAARDAYLFHRAATIPGVSGSPIFNENWQFVGVHTHGEFEGAMHIEGRSSNWGTRIISIVLDAQSKGFDFDQTPRLKELLDAGFG